MSVFSDSECMRMHIFGRKPALVCVLRVVILTRKHIILEFFGEDCLRHLEILLNISKKTKKKGEN